MLEIKKERSIRFMEDFKFSYCKQGCRCGFGLQLAHGALMSVAVLNWEIASIVTALSWKIPLLTVLQPLHVILIIAHNFLHSIDLTL